MGFEESTDWKPVCHDSRDGRLPEAKCPRIRPLPDGVPISPLTNELCSRGMVLTKMVAPVGKLSLILCPRSLNLNFVSRSRTCCSSTSWATPNCSSMSRKSYCRTSIAREKVRDREGALASTRGACAPLAGRDGRFYILMASINTKESYANDNCSSEKSSGGGS